MLEHQWNIFAIVRFMWRHNPWICLHGCCAFHSLMNHSWRMNFKHHPINITVPNIQLIWGMQQQQTCYQSQWYNHIYSIATTATLLQRSSKCRHRRRRRHHEKLLLFLFTVHGICQNIFMLKLYMRTHSTNIIIKLWHTHLSSRIKYIQTYSMKMLCRSDEAWTKTHSLFTFLHLFLVVLSFRWVSLLFLT